MAFSLNADQIVRLPGLSALAPVFLSTLIVSGCGKNPEETALEQRFAVHFQDISSRLYDMTEDREYSLCVAERLAPLQALHDIHHARAMQGKDAFGMSANDLAEGGAERFSTIFRSRIAIQGAAIMMACQENPESPPAYKLF
jgi:hypothetical protein